MGQKSSKKECVGIGERIRNIRASLSIPTFAEKIGVHKSTLSRYEKEESYPDAPLIMKLCNQFNINPNWLLTGEGPKKKPDPPVGYTAAHNELKRRLKLKIHSFGCGFLTTLLGEDYQKLIDYIFNRYLPSDEELEKFCQIVQNFDPETVKSGRQTGEFHEADKEYLIGLTKNKTHITDSKLLSGIILLIEKISQENDIRLSNEKKAEIIALVYEDIATDSSKLPFLRKKAVRLFNLATKS